MKFRTIRRLVYFKRARHRHGHGIHSPFLFSLITTVVEDKRRLPEYKYFERLRNEAMNLMGCFSSPSFTDVYNQFGLSISDSQKLYKKIELPLRYGKVVFRLIREFKPSSIINYGPTLGTNLALMAIANSDNPVYQIDNDLTFELFCRELLNDSAIKNIHFLHENLLPPVNPEFIVINYPENYELSQSVVHKCLEFRGDNNVVIIRGIHESKEMEGIWQEMIDSDRVRVSLDLFEIGIALFRKGLQKENFIQQF